MLLPDFVGCEIKHGTEPGDKAVDREDVVSDGTFIGHPGGKAAEPSTVIFEPGRPSVGGEWNAERWKTKLEDATADGGQQRVRTRREQKERGIRGWFLEGFEEDVGRRGVHAIHLVEDGDFARGDGGGDLDFGDQLAGRVGGYLAHLTCWPQGETIGVLVRREVGGGTLGV